MIRIECEPAVSTTCDCCGTLTTRLTRFVYEDDAAHAAYYACFGEEHPNDVRAIVSIGLWWGAGTPADRVAFALRLWQDDSRFGVTVEDATKSPWSHIELLGRMLERREALEHPRLTEVFHLTDHIFAEDAEIKAFFSRCNAVKEMSRP